MSLTSLKLFSPRAAPRALFAVAAAAASLGTVGASVQESPSGLFIRCARLLEFHDSTPRVRPCTSVLIEGREIAAVGDAGELDAPAGARIIDARGLTLAPGLIDMHVHLWDQAELGAYLAHGVTTVRNASGMPFHLLMAEQIAAGELPGPRLITTGPILNGSGPNAQANHQIVDSPQAARAAVRQQHDAGFRRLKVYSNLSRESYEAIHDEARRLEMTIMGHSPEGVRGPGMPYERPFDLAFEELLDDGFVTFEHMETIVWHALRDDLDEAKARALAKRIAASKAVVDPTLLAFYNLLRVAETKGAYLERFGVDTLNPFITKHEADVYARWSREDVDDARQRFAFYQRATRIFHEEGVTLVAGSDAGIFTNIPGASLITELELLVEAGIAPHDALRAATVNAAAALDETGRSACVAPGCRADLVLTRDDPLRDVAAVGRPEAVIANGRYLSGADLKVLLRSAAETSYERTERNVLAGLAAQGSGGSAPSN